LQKFVFYIFVVLPIVVDSFIVLFVTVDRRVKKRIGVS